MKRINHAMSIAAISLSCALPAAAHADLTLGFSTAKTGPYVSLASTNEIAVDIAVEEINAKGGVNGKTLKVSKFDTGGDPRQAALAVRRFAEDENALAIIGPFSSSEVRVSFPAGERLGIVQMSMSSSAPGLTKGFSYGFRNTTDEVKVINSVLDTLKKRDGNVSTAAIIYATDDTVSKAIGSAILPASFKQHDIAIKGDVDFLHNAFDLSPQVSRLMQLDTDIIGVGAPPEGAINLAKEAARQGLKARLIGGATFADPDLPSRMSPAGKGVTVGTTFFADTNERTRAFAAEFAKRASERGFPRKEPNQMDAAAYDIVYLYAEAMKQVGVKGKPENLAKEREAIRDTLPKLKAYPGVEGALTFDDSRDMLKPIYVLESDGENWNLIGTQELH